MTQLRERLKGALAERYSIDRQLGRGGMARVYLARDLKHDRPVAVKVLYPELAATLAADRFLREIQVAARLNHPYILPLYESGEADGLLYYVMPYVDGESLRQELDREKQLAIDEALRITQRVAAALDYAHRQGIVHRDIKPENILLQEGEPVVADFGIALAVSTAGSARLTESGMAVGTTTYMSPEQASGSRELGPKTDIYSLGCVLYEMLSGEPPFAGPTRQAIIAKQLTEAPPNLRALRETVPQYVAVAVAKALAKEPPDRFATAAEFSNTLATAPATSSLRSPVAVHPTSPIETMRILVVEDEPGIALGLEDDLKLEGYEVTVVRDGETAVKYARTEPFDLILLDVMLPRKDGFEVCRELRRGGLTTPIIMLTAKAHEAEKVMGLELGADDYVTKPFSPAELRARIKAVLRRAADEAPQVYRFGDIEADFRRFELRRAGKAVGVTPIEFKLLATFVEHRGRVLSRAKLKDLVWGEGTAMTDRVVDTHVANLRKKIEPEPARPRYLVSVRGVGYRFDA